jgi:hypothetical protein
MKYSLAGLAGLAALTTAQGTWPSELVGTWSTKSNKTLTGPVRRRCHALYHYPQLTSLAGFLRRPERRVHRALAHRHLLLFHRGRLLRGGLLPRHREPARSLMSQRDYAVAAWNLGEKCGWLVEFDAAGG